MQRQTENMTDRQRDRQTKRQIETGRLRQREKGK